MSDPRNHPKLQSGYTYHICNQGNNGENLFKEERNYPHFLRKYQRFIHPIVQTFAYCLMPNHFHILVQIKSYEELHLAFPKRFPKPPFKAATALEIDTAEQAAFDTIISELLSQQFGNWFSGYARSINKTYHRKGKLFHLPFNRILVSHETYFTYLVAYLHRNPIHHGFCTDWTTWQHSSYAEILQFLKEERQIVSSSTLLDFLFLKDWFGSVEHFLKIHQESLAILEDKWRLED